MGTSTYQNLKLEIVDIVSLSKDAIHIHVGLLIFFATIILWKKRKVSLSCMIPVLLVAFGMEAIDLYDDLNSLGHMRLGDSFHDIINTTIWPCLIVIFFQIKHTIK